MKKLLLVLLLLASINTFAQNYNFEQGIEYTKKDEFEKAIEYFSKAIEQEPKTGIYYYWRALCYNRLSDNANSLRDINSAINLFSKKERNTFSTAYEFRGDIYLKLDEEQKAIEDYSTAIKLNPKDEDPYFKRANIYYYNEQYELDEADYKKVLNFDETSVRAYAGLSRNYIETGKLVEAEINANKAIKISPDYSEGYYYRGMLYLKKKEYELAIEDLIASYIQSEYDDFNETTLLSSAHYNYTYTLTKLKSKISTVKSPEKLIEVRAKINEYARNYIDALNDYDQLIDRVDEYDKARHHFNKALLYGWLENYDSEIYELNKAADIDSTQAAIYAYLGVSYNGKNNYKLADEFYSKAISLNGEISWYYCYRGKNRIDMKLYEDGLKDLNQAISLDKKYFLAYYYRSLLYKDHFNLTDKAKQDFEFIATNDTSLENGNSLRQFALIYLNKKSDAINWQNKILGNEPNFLEYYSASKLYSLLNNKDKSIEYLKLAVLKGFKKTIELETEKDFSNVKSSIEFKNIINELKLEKRDNKSNESLNNETVLSQPEKVSLPMKNRGVGTYEIPCTINQLKLNMIFDTGASDISISQTEVDFMLKNDYLSDSDILGTSSYIDANGDVEIGTTILLRTVEIGGFILKNVRASVVHKKNAPLLFGQSALSKYGKITIDNSKKTITLTK